MRVWLYSLCWNDGPRLRFFFRHYDSFVSHYVIYDDDSDEDTLAILRAHPRVEVRRLERSHPDSFVRSEQSLSSHCWKECRTLADWVIVTDIDELLWHPHMTAYLAAQQRDGVTVIPALGFQMIHNSFPPETADLSRLLTRGTPLEHMMKLSIFNPSAIAEINFDHGRHRAAPTGAVVLPRTDELLLLHYKYLGFNETLARYRQLFAGLGPVDIERGWGHQYWQSSETFRREWSQLWRDAVDYRQFAGGANLDSFPIPRWWRQRGWLTPGEPTGRQGPP